MKSLPTSLIGAIGNTPLVELKRLTPNNGSRVLVKLENKNPSGSAKDRSALAMIEAAERSGSLRPGVRVVEATGGSAGTSIAMICAVKGYDSTIVTSDAFTDEKLQTMRAFGANLEIIHGEHGKGTYPELLDRLVERARELGDIEGNCYLGQMSNPANPIAYHRMADEILEQTDGAVDAFAMSVGTGGCFTGTMERLKECNPAVVGIAVEPDAYRHISGGPKGVHHIDGIGDGPPGVLFRYDLVDSTYSVTDKEANEIARELASKEGIFCGKSSAANVLGAIRAANALGPGKTVVTVICDTGYKYLSSDLFDRAIP